MLTKLSIKYIIILKDKWEFFDHMFQSVILLKTPISKENNIGFQSYKKSSFRCCKAEPLCAYAEKKDR